MSFFLSTLISSPLLLSRYPFFAPSSQFVSALLSLVSAMTGLFVEEHVRVRGITFQHYGQSTTNHVVALSSFTVLRNCTFLNNVGTVEFERSNNVLVQVVLFLSFRAFLKS